MYRLTVQVVQVMDLYDVTATLFEDQGPDVGWHAVAQRSDTVAWSLSGSGDAFHSILEALRLWSEMTIHG